ncbi:cytochrome c oxidase subunit 3 [Stratiformator vulcanicus]|uniref:Cytochrome c oxidase subunit 3 n=1 Tax=Stratiformator vulcanicus TaxID=2527980 RepID=A0A517R300_9PLAN|nr:cytochrome c oxidase subunit 3 [Stratiformator vulcanicus]QDT38223.1 Cytochrome c oxidase subunit 3 [Stratiformator vulcanicus]
MATATDPNAEIADGEHGEHGHDSPFFAHHFESWNQQFEAGKLGMWAFLVQEVLFFSGLFCAYAVYRLTHPEIFEYADQFLSTPHGFLNTIVLLFSSLTMAWGVRCAMLGNQKGLVICLGVTLFCAALFLGVKAYEYTEKWHAELIWGGALYDRSTGSMEALIRLPHDGVLSGSILEARVADALWILEVTCVLAAVVCLVGGTLSYKIDQGLAVISSGAVLGLCLIGAFVMLLTMPAPPGSAEGVEAVETVVSGPVTARGVIWAVLVGGVIGGLYALLSTAFSSRIIATTLCAVGFLTAVGIFLGAECSMALHHFMHGGHDAEHSAADHHDGDHGGDHGGDHSDGEHGEDAHESSARVDEEVDAAESDESPNEMEPRDVSPSKEMSEQLAAAGDDPDGPTELTDKIEIPAIADRPRRLGIFFGIYYCMTGLHAIHILAGIGVITWILCRAVLGHFTPEYFGPVDFVGLYWHLVDLVWIYLFPLLYLIG